MGIEETLIHMHNRQVPNSAKTMKRLDEFLVTGFPHPPYSPGVSHFDFCFFGWSKDIMGGQKLCGSEHVHAFMLDLYQNLDPNTLVSVCHELIERLERVITLNGEYYLEEVAEIRLYSVGRAGCGRLHTFRRPYISRRLPRKGHTLIVRRT
jgi:hypothetical protein